MSELKPKNRSQDLVSLGVKYRNWYIVPDSGQLVFRKHILGKPRTIRTGVIGKINARTGAVDGMAKAREFVEREIEKIRSGKSDQEIKRSREGVLDPLVEDIWAELIEIKLVGKEVGTVKNYHKDWNHGISGFWAKKHISEMTTDNVIRYKAWYIKEKSHRLPEKTLDFFKMLVRYAASKKYIEDPPDLAELSDLDEIIKKMKRYKKAGRVYTNEEETAMLACWQQFLETQLGGTTERHKKLLAARARCGMAMGLRCGMRVMEILKAKVSDMDFDRNVIRVWSQKNHEWREVPMVPMVRNAITYQIEANAHLKSDWLFPMPEDPTEHITYGVFSKTWHRVRKFAGITDTGPLKARFHDCRKTFATRTAELGWPWKVACEILDMSGDVYEKTYANRITFEVKQSFMLQAFGGEA